MSFLRKVLYYGLIMAMGVVLAEFFGIFGPVGSRYPGDLEIYQYFLLAGLAIIIGYFFNKIFGKDKSSG